MQVDSWNKLEEAMVDWLKTQDLQSMSPMSSEKITEIHYIAYYLYKDKQYEKAVHFYRLLTLINPSEKKYWKGLGASLQLSNKYEEAIESYINVLLNSEQTDPHILIHAADCYFALNQIEQGLKTLEGAKIYAKQQKNTRVLNHVALMKDLWSKKNT